MIVFTRRAQKEEGRKVEDGAKEAHMKVKIVEALIQELQNNFDRLKRAELVAGGVGGRE